MSLDWVAKQIATARSASSLDLSVPRYNPRPKGVIRPGSATDVVLEFFKKRPGRYFSRSQILYFTGQTDKAVGWALSYLEGIGHITSHPDTTRNSRYLRYAMSKERV